MGDFFTALINNKVLICGISGWAVAQILKTLIYAMINREIRWERMIGDGGMPSAHSATVSAMAVSSGILYGFGSFEFAIACMLAIIVMHDAMGVRMETGRQGKILNEMIDFFRTEGGKLKRICRTYAAAGGGRLHSWNLCCLSGT